MGRHELPEQTSPESTQPSEPTRALDRVIEVKVIAATAVPLLASVAYAVINAVQAQPDILNGLPPWLRFIIIASLVPLLTFFSGYQMPSNRV